MIGQHDSRGEAGEAAGEHENRRDSHTPQQFFQVTHHSELDKQTHSQMQDSRMSQEEKKNRITL